MGTEVFKRRKEVEKLISFIGNGKVNVVTGLRRSGKTYLLDTVFKNKLINETKLYNESDFGLLYLDGENKNIREETQLDSKLSEFRQSNKKIVIIDEVQLVNGFASSLKAFVKRNKDISVFVTGSNSDLLSKEIIDKFQGYAESLIVSPLTYKEILEEMPSYPLNSYLTFGGLPYVTKLADGEKRSELYRIYTEIYQRDIENKLDKELEYLSFDQVEEIIELIASSSAPFSPSSLAKRFLMGLERTSVDEIKVAHEIRKVLNVLDKSFLIKSMSVNDYNEITPLSNIGLNKKYYFSDNGLRYINCKTDAKTIGLCLENAVFIELNSKGIVPSGKLILAKGNNIDGEIDFNYRLGDEKYHMQVTHTINVWDYGREIGNLKKLIQDGRCQVIYIINSLGQEEADIEYINAKEFFLS